LTGTGQRPGTPSYPHAPTPGDRAGHDPPACCPRPAAPHCSATIASARRGYRCGLTPAFLLNYVTRKFFNHKPKKFANAFFFANRHYACPVRRQTSTAAATFGQWIPCGLPWRSIHTAYPSDPLSLPYRSAMPASGLRSQPDNQLRPLLHFVATEYLPARILIDEVVALRVDRDDVAVHPYEEVRSVVLL
jgi:hypothetical protein